MTAPTQTRPPARPQLPKGLQWSTAWKVDGEIRLSNPPVEMPVNDRYEITGDLWVCPRPGCASEKWLFEPVDPDAVPCCAVHPNRLVVQALVASDADPAAGARQRLALKVRAVYQRRREQAIAPVQERLAEARLAVEQATRSTVADMRGHLPSIAVSGVVLTSGTVFEVADPVYAAVAGTGCGVAALAAYVVVLLVRRWRKAARRDEKAARNDRRVARHVATGLAAAGMWLAFSAPLTVFGAGFHTALTLLFGLLLTYAVNHSHWTELWATRHRLKELARLRAEADARRAAEEAARAQTQPLAVVQPSDDDPLVMGQRMAAEWARIAASQTVMGAFPQMPRTWIDPAQTIPITAPIDGSMQRIGWEYHGLSEPGALVARAGMQSPVTAAKDWLAAVLFDGAHNPSTVSLIDRPGGQANRFTLMVTDSIPLGEPVRWQGKAGVKELPDGTKLVHRGRALDGNDYYHPIFVPGQAFGGLDVGTRGGGKSAGTILYLLNCLASGIFPFLFDPKQLVNYPDFIGIFPIGVTGEHRDAFLAALTAERKRRERAMSRSPKRDEFGREVHGEPVWDLRNGPPITHVWEEFHDLSTEEEFVGKLVNHIRFERDAAMGGKFITQGGGLADLSSSVLRGLLNQTELTTYRMDDHQARLAGRKDGSYTASDLPPLPGMCLVAAPEAPAIPMRTAYVPRTLNHPDSVFNTLWGRSAERVLQLPPAGLPAETVAVFRKYGVMDIWERAQGPGGLQRLLADAEDEEYGGPSPAPASAMGSAPKLDPASVILAIAHQFPGLGPTAVSQNDGWLRRAAGGKAPALSTVTRSAAKLKKDGLLATDDGYRVTEKAAQQAELLFMALLGGGVAGRPGDRAEREEEQEDV